MLQALRPHLSSHSTYGATKPMLQALRPHAEPATSLKAACRALTTSTTLEASCRRAGQGLRPHAVCSVSRRKSAAALSVLLFQHYAIQPNRTPEACISCTICKPIHLYTHTIRAPHTATYVSSYLILPHMCPHTSYCRICVLILLSVRPHTAMCVCVCVFAIAAALRLY